MMKMQKMNSRGGLLAISLMLILVPAALRAGVDTAWVRRYDGPRHGADWATCIAVDSAGNVYVAGPSAADTGYVNLDFVTIKYYSNGDTAWVRRQDFGYGNDQPQGVAVDAQANVYVTGYGNGRIATVKYSPTGTRLWYTQFGTQGGADGLALDQQGNVLVCGSTLGTTPDAATVKYRPNGDTAWARLYDWAGYDDYAVALATGALSDVAVACEGYDGGSGSDYVILKYDSAGARQWVSVYHGPADWDVPSDAAVTVAGDVCVTGSSEGTASAADYLTVMCGPGGETLWTRRYNGAANGDDRATAVAVDSSENVYVTGYSYDPALKDDYVTIKYDSIGNVRWVARYNGPAGNYDDAFGIALDGWGCAYVTGRSRGVGTAYDYATVKYGITGETLWTARFSSFPSGNDEARSIAVGVHAEVVVTGQSDGPTGIDILTIKYVQEIGAAESPAAPGISSPALVVRPSVLRERAMLYFSAAKMASVRVRAFEVSGRAVRTLYAGQLAAGAHSVYWDGTDDSGSRVPAGIYSIVLDGAGVVLRTTVTVLD